MGDWPVIARYLKNGESPVDADQLDLVVEHFPIPDGELEALDPGMSIPIEVMEEVFDSHSAFKKLTGRLKEENLI